MSVPLFLCRTQLLVDKRVFDRADDKQRHKDTIYGHSKLLWDQAKADMDRGAYVPKLDAGTEHCTRELSWWGK